jgi:hypothetical protein
MGTTPSHFIVCSAGTCGHRTSCSSIEFLLSPDEDCGLSTPMIHPRQQVTKLGIGIKLGTASNHKTFYFLYSNGILARGLLFRSYIHHHRLTTLLTSTCGSLEQRMLLMGVARLVDRDCKMYALQEMCHILHSYFGTVMVTFPSVPIPTVNVPTSGAQVRAGLEGGSIPKEIALLSLMIAPLV